MQVVWHIICMMYDGVVSYNIKFMGFYYILLICTCTYHVSRPWMSASILHITCTGEYLITILQDIIWNYKRSFRLYFIVFTKYELFLQVYFCRWRHHWQQTRIMRISISLKKISRWVNGGTHLFSLKVLVGGVGYYLIIYCIHQKK